MRPAPIQPSDSLVGVGNREFLCGVKGYDLGTRRGEDYLLLNARRRDAVARRAIRLHREDHAGLELDRLTEGVEPRDERPLMQPEPEAMAEVQSEGVHF